MKKVCFVTGGRMDYGHIYMLLKSIQQSRNLDLKIIATGMHLSPEFGLTYKNILNDGFSIDKKVECILSSDSEIGVAKSVGLATISFADAFESIKPDLVVLMGDRFETLAAAQVCLFMKIPIAHLAGGDVTEGAYDESIRHSITKMAHLHFVTNHDAYNRVLQLGENPKNVFNVGSPTIDYLKSINYVSKSELSKLLNFKLMNKNIIVTFHPVTLESEIDISGFNSLISALEMLDNDIGIIFTLSNADNGGREINKMIIDFVKKNKNSKSFEALGQFLYYNCLNNFDCVVGNSSSGLYEVPSFSIPTINIGDRQKGRVRASSVIDIPNDKMKIFNAINESLDSNLKKISNPYGDGNSSEKIEKIIGEFLAKGINLQKHFFKNP